jgi:hypothetical protein
MEFFDNSFWRSGYSIGFGILIIGFIIAKLNKRN